MGYETADQTALRTAHQAASRTAKVTPRRCEVCGNLYDLAFEVVTAGHRHVFDCFECAIHALAPICDHCQCRIIGHGMQADGRMFCCAHCAAQEGVPELSDRA